MRFYIGSFTVHGPAQSLGSIADSPRPGVTSTGLVGMASPSFSTALASQLPARFTPRLAGRAHRAPWSARPSSQKDRRNLYADALLPGRLRRDLLAESVLDDVAANLLLSRGQDGAAPASVPALPPTGARVARDATGPGFVARSGRSLRPGRGGSGGLRNGRRLVGPALEHPEYP